MSAPILKKGRSGPVETGQTITKSDKDGVTVVVEGTYSSLKTLGAQRVAQYVPAGYTFISSRLSPTGNGFGELAISCVKYENEGASGFAPVRTTFRIKMAEVQYDLEDHPYLKGTYRDICLKWLATDEAVRVKLENGGTKYYYTNENGEQHQINDQRALKFCAAYMAGITKFTRYFPVVDKISIWKNPPGLLRSGNSFSSGSPKFSANIGHWDNPPISLNGFPSGHWFKSDDSWEENENKTWTETEQWTYTPETSSGDHSWIYTELDSGSGGGAS